MSVPMASQSASGPYVRTAVVEDLRARTARTGHAHRPVVLLGPEPDDAVLREPGDLHPQRERLVVAVQHRGPQPALLQPPAAVGLRLGDQVPGVLDGAFLEVVTEAEVAAHLEEGAVPGGLADVLDVGGAHALLHAGRPRVRRRLLAQEVGLERHHARVHEQQRRVRDQQRRGGHCLVTGRLEVRDEAAADLGGVHQSLSSRSRWLRSEPRPRWLRSERQRASRNHWLVPPAQAVHQAPARGGHATRFPSRSCRRAPRRRTGARPRRARRAGRAAPRG